MCNNNIKVKMSLYGFQLIAGVLCYAFLQVPAGADLMVFSALHLLAKKNKEVMNAIENKIPMEAFDFMTSTANVAQFLIQVAFCFWVVIFLKLITQFPRSFQDSGKKSRFNFEYVFHLVAVNLYCIPSVFLLVRLWILGLSTMMWNITTAAAFGLIAGALHSVYTCLLKMEYKELTSSATSYNPLRAEASA